MHTREGIRSSRRFIAGAAAVITASVLVAATSRPRPAAAEGSFRALAAADGARLSIIAANAPGTNVPIDGGGPVAQASLDSLGTSQSFAAQPYPGDLAISGPGLIAGLSNGQVTPPNYPLYVSADHPINPEQNIEQPGYQLKATAAEREVTASAHSGGNSADNAVASSTATATARAGSDDSTVVGDASSLAVGFSAGPLTIGHVSAKASVTRQADGTLVRQASLDVAGAKVGDTPISVTAEGITAGAAEVPFGDQTAVTKALSDSGVTLRYIAGRDTENGVVAPVLEVSWAGAAPGPFSPVGFVWTLGRALARVEGGGGSGGSAPAAPAAASGDAPAPAPSGSGATDGGGPGGATPGLPAAAGETPTPSAFGAAPVGGVRPQTSPAPSAGVTTGAIGGVAVALDEYLGGDGSVPGPVTPTAEIPPSPQAVLAAGSAALAPPEFDTTSIFGALALAVTGTWILSRGWSARRRPGHGS